MTTNKKLLDTLRDPTTEPPLFRKTTTTLASHLAKETADLTPSLLVPILRSGITLLPAFSSTFPEASIGILGIRRDERTAHAHLYYDNLPAISPTDDILILDPMVATGGTASLALNTLKLQGATPSRITLIGIIASKEGIASLQKNFSEVKLRVLAIDPELSPTKMILPGLGDFGDRYFGTL